MSDLSPDKTRLLTTPGHILALGGPGCGKTFVALHKADHEIRSNTLRQGQRILFLSFARATIARVAQQAGKFIHGPQRDALEIDTYHGFAWKLLRSHGYLLNASSRIQLLPPPQAASRLAHLSPEQRTAEKLRLFDEECLLHFDLFAAMTVRLLSGSQALARIVCDSYPILILDEFQDTNADEWQLIRLLGRQCRLVALADAEQRIYEFRGADPRRISDFVSAFNPSQFDFSSENHRSSGADILTFGNELLSQSNKGRSYNNVKIVRYQPRKGIGLHADAKGAVLKACERLRKSGKDDWSLAILVPTKRLMLDISDYLGDEQAFSKGTRYPPIKHDVALESEGPSLAAGLIAGLLEGAAPQDELGRRLIADLCSHMRGRRGNDPPPQADLGYVTALENYLRSGAIKGPARKLIVDECHRIAVERTQLMLTGDPDEDWLSIRRLLSTSVAPLVQKVAEDARYLRLLHKGAALRASLSDLWRRAGQYSGASVAVRNALLQEHLSASTKQWKGVQVMTMHKSKGKEFDEVLIYEGSHQGRIVRSNASQNDVAQARLALRVAVTRAMRLATILTPKNDPCPLL